MWHLDGCDRLFSVMTGCRLGLLGCCAAFALLAVFMNLQFCTVSCGFCPVLACSVLRSNHTVCSCWQKVVSELAKNICLCYCPVSIGGGTLPLLAVLGAVA